MLAVVPYEYQFVWLRDNVIKLASKLNHNCDNLAGENFPPINLQSISLNNFQAKLKLNPNNPRHRFPW